MNNLQVAVVGGSLGGLTAASLLRDDGHDVTVFERSSTELEQRGAGIGFLPASSRYLVERAGVPLDQLSVETSHIRYLGRDDRVVHEEAHRYHFSSWNTVYRSLLDQWDQDRYRLDHELVSFDQSDARVTLGLAHSGREVEVDADLLVCADGVGSASRRRLQPEAVAGYAGYVAWRGMVPESALPSEVVERLFDAITYYVFANSHVLVYPIPGPDGSLGSGERLVNFVWYRNYLEGGELEELMTDTAGRSRELSMPPGLAAAHHVAELRACAEARLPASLAGVVLATEEPFIQVVYDIEVERMAFGRACLLGDAAFAARPHAAAGTAKAAEDGWQLAAALRRADDVQTALVDWEAQQLSLGRRLVDRTRRIGRRSQIDNSWQPGDPEFIFGLHEPGR